MDGLYLDLGKDTDDVWQVHTLHTENPIKFYLNIVKEINVLSTEN